MISETIRNNYMKKIAIVFLFFCFIKINAQTYTNPVIKTSSADPGVYYHAATGYYYVYNTDRFAWKSKDLVNWTALNNTTVFGNLGSGAFWAPEVFMRQNDGMIYMVYAMDQLIYIAQSSSPEGPFNKYAGPFKNSWSIDPTYLRDSDGKEYLFWNEGGCAGTSGLWVGDFNADLTAVSNQQHLFSNADVGSWVTECVVEAPNMLKHNGTFYLVFSGNGTGPNYKLGYATSSSPHGPYTMYSGNPIMQSVGNFVGPGHCSFTWSPDGSQMFIVYHSGYNGLSGRLTCVDKAEFVTNPAGGADILKIPGPSDNPLPYPLTVSNCTAQTITFNPIANKLISDTSFSINATASSGLPVIFSIISGPATINGNKITLNGTSGQVVVAADQSGDSTYCKAIQQTQICVVSDPNIKTIIWHFENSLEGWKLTNHYTGSASASILSLTITGGDPYMNSPDSLNVNATSFPYILIRAKNMTSTTTAGIYWTRTDNQIYSEAMHINFPVNASETNYTIYKINISANAQWIGTIKQIRVDFTQTASSGNVDIDYIALDNDGVITELPAKKNDNSTIEIFPNPNEGLGFYLSLNEQNNISNEQLEILNLQGQIIFSKQLSIKSTEFINLNHQLAKGIYLIKYFNGQKNIFKKLIID